MPYTTEHSATIKSPSLFKKGDENWGSKDITTGVRIILGVLRSNDKWETQTYRFKANKFTVAQAKKWLKDHKIKYILFEPASGEKKSEVDMKITSSIFDAEDIELRTVDDKDTMFGTVVKFDKLSKPLPQIGGVMERIKKGAFTRTIKNDEIVAVWNHNMDKVLGNTKAGTLRLIETNSGLDFEIDLPDTSWGKDAATSVKRGDVRGMSFWFRKIKDEWDESNLNKVIRTLIEVDLVEISPTPMNIAAYSSSKANMRTVKDDYEDYSEEQRNTEMENQKVINGLKLKNQRITELEKEI